MNHAPIILRIITVVKIACLYIVLGAVIVSGCSSAEKHPSFDPRNCFEIIPEEVKGLTVTSGPRSKENIIRDMVPAICHARALFKHMSAEGDTLKPGSVVFRVVVEYTGEVYAADVHESTIESENFLRKVCDLIMDTDFVYWGGTDDTDTVFLYPVTFDR